MGFLHFLLFVFTLEEGGGGGGGFIYLLFIYCSFLQFLIFCFKILMGVKEDGEGRVFFLHFSFFIVYNFFVTFFNSRRGGRGHGLFFFSFFFFSFFVTFCVVCKNFRSTFYSHRGKGVWVYFSLFIAFFIFKILSNLFVTHFTFGRVKGA
jgi:hypothetical protein